MLLKDLLKLVGDEMQNIALIDKDDKILEYIKEFKENTFKCN